MSIHFQTYSTPEAAEAAVTALMPDFVATPISQFFWAQSWHSVFKTDYLGILVLKDNVPVWFFDFELIMRKGLKIARNIGETHSVYNFPIHNPNAGVWDDSDQLQFKHQLIAVLRKHHIDAWDCTNHLESYGDTPSPMLKLGMKTVQDQLLYTELNPDFEVFTQDKRGSTGKKRDRKQDNALTKLGEWQCLNAETPAEKQAIITAFFNQKEERLNTKKIKNGVADPRIPQFFAALSTHANKKYAYYFRLSALHLDNEIIATCGSITNGAHCSGLFVSFKPVLSNEASPGLSLQRHEIKTFCQENIRYFDLGAGNDRYKRTWLKDVWTIHAFVLPITFKGRIFGAITYIKRGITLYVRTNPRLLSIARKTKQLLFVVSKEHKDD